MGREGHRRPQLARALGFALVGVSLLGLPTAGAQTGRPAVEDKNTLLTHVSQPVAIRYWLAHPEQAPAPLQQRFQQTQEVVARARGQAAGLLPGAQRGAADVPHRFNLDTVGLPQNEESITVCDATPNIVLGGTNDYRGLLDPER